MIRFVELTGPTPSEPPRCAFLDTVTETFVQTVDGSHVFASVGDFPESAIGHMCLSMLPRGFLDPVRKG